MSSVVLDHLVVAAQALAEGCAFIEAQLGVRPQPGGKHVAMGTHNAMLGLGPKQYLEVIAIDPEGVNPARPRWYDLDEPRMRAALAEGPRLIHWAAQTDDIEAAKAHGANGVYFTFNPSRAAELARAKQLGFEEKDADVYVGLDLS